MMAKISLRTGARHTQRAEGQRLVIERLDRLVDATTRERTVSIERLARIEQRLDAVERRLESPPPTT